MGGFLYDNQDEAMLELLDSQTLQWKRIPIAFGIGFVRFQTGTADVIKKGPSGEWKGKITIWFDEGLGKTYGHKKEGPRRGDFAPGDTIQSIKCLEAGIY